MGRQYIPNNPDGIINATDWRQHGLTADDLAECLGCGSRFARDLLLGRELWKEQHEEVLTAMMDSIRVVADWIIQQDEWVMYQDKAEMRGDIGEHLPKLGESGGYFLGLYRAAFLMAYDESVNTDEKPTPIWYWEIQDGEKNEE